MTRRVLRTVALVGLVLPGVLPTRAQTVLSLPEALDRAREQSLVVRSADAAVAAQGARLDGIRGERLPAVSLDVGGGQRYGLSFDQTTGSLTQQAVESVDAGLSAQWVVFDGAARRARQRAAEADMQGAALDRTRAGIVAQIEVLRVVLARAQAASAVEIATAQVVAEEQLRSEVRVQVEAGARPPYEGLQQDERVAAARTARVQAERDVAGAEAELARRLGLDALASVAVPLPPDDGTALPEVATLIAQALTARADLQSAAQTLVAAEASRRAARAGRLPSVALYGSVGTGFTSANGDLGLVGQFGDNRAGALGVRVAVPLFDRGRTAAGVREAQSQIDRAQASLEDARRAIALDVRQAVLDIESAREQAALGEVRVAAAEAALAAEESRYREGATTLQAVALLRARVVEARTARAQARAAAAVYRIVLQLATGAEAER